MDKVGQVGERCRHAVTVALEGHQAGWRYPLAVLDEAVEGPPQRHQAGNLAGMRIGDSAGQNAMHDLPPLLDTALLEPGIERIDVRKEPRWHRRRIPALIFAGLLIAAFVAQFLTLHRGAPYGITNRLFVAVLMAWLISNSLWLSSALKQKA